jgi:hypothetical protein
MHKSPLSKRRHSVCTKHSLSQRKGRVDARRPRDTIRNLSNSHGRLASDFCSIFRPIDKNTENPRIPGVFILCFRKTIINSFVQREFMMLQKQLPFNGLASIGESVV